jgi:hypothetical protein
MSEQEEIVKLWQQVRELKRETDSLKGQLKLIRNMFRNTSDQFAIWETGNSS